MYHSQTFTEREIHQQAPLGVSKLVARGNTSQYPCAREEEAAERIHRVLVGHKVTP